MEDVFVIVGGFVVFIVILALFGIIIAFPVMWLWNWLMPEIFGLMTISFWQELGLYLLVGLLTKGGKSTVKKN